MTTSSNSSRKFCFISNSDQSYLAEYIDLSRFDSNLDFSFENIDLKQLKEYKPNIIIIDQYFHKKDCTAIIERLKANFKDTNIYILSPEYNKNKGVIQSKNNKNHYYSSFSVDILNHINTISKENSLEIS
jgi:DNA-binding NarL/FixJ family response regulator